MTAPKPEDVARELVSEFTWSTARDQLGVSANHEEIVNHIAAVLHQRDRAARAAAIEEAARWQPIETAPRDRYILLCDALAPRWDGNMEVGKWFGDDHPFACFWSAGGLNGGLELGRAFTHWRELPDDPAAIRALGEESATASRTPETG